MSQQKAIYFISDLHLGTIYDETSHGREKMVVEFLNTISGDASELYMVGDILDYWFEYRTVIPRGYVRFFGALASLVDKGVKVTWLIGNHDIWLFDYLRDEIGIEVVDGQIITELLGKRFLITHGDGVGKLPRGFRFIRSIFRNKLCQKLYAAIHPRWTVPFALRWSSHSRKKDKAMKVFDIKEDYLSIFAQEWQKQHPDSPVDYFVFGHRHIVVDEKLPDSDAQLIILGDWLTNFTYGRYDGIDFKLKKFCIKKGKN